MSEPLQRALEAMRIPLQQIVNCHIHLPEINDLMLENASQSESHVMIPEKIIKDTIPLADPRSFYKKNSEFSGSAVILPVESHNIHGKGSFLYCSNEQVLKLAKRYPEFYIPFMSVNLTDKSAPNRIQELHTQGMQGLKHHAIEGYSLINPLCEPSLKLLEQLEIPIVIHLGDTPFPGVNLEFADPKILITLSNKHPNLNILATHFATPLHNDLFWVASRYPNIFLDTAEFPCYWCSYPENPYGGLLNPLNTRRIGTHKIIFGTDFPMPTFRRTTTGKIEIVVHDPAEYLYEFLNLSDAYITIEEKKKILCENFWNFLRKTRSEVVSSNKKIVKKT